VYFEPFTCDPSRFGLPPVKIKKNSDPKDSDESGVFKVALTKEQRNELLFLIVEKLQTRPDYWPSNLEARLTSEQRSNLPRLAYRVYVDCETAGAEENRTGLAAASA
jgi:hypothetical protein